MKQNGSISSMPRLVSDSVSFHVLTIRERCPTTADNGRTFLAALATLLHRQYKTARTETRWHLLLKIRQMPIQTSASRGYVLFRSADKRCTKVLKLSADCGHSPRSVQSLKNTDHRRYQTRYRLEIPPFCVSNSAAGWQFKQADTVYLQKSMPTTFHAPVF